MLTTKDKEWHDRRKKGIGGSDATILMSGDQEAIYRLWEIKTGRLEPENLDDVFAVALGNYTEQFNREWFSKVTMLPVISAGDFRHNGFQVCNLDGEVVLHDGRRAVFEAKHTHGGATVKTALAKYQPQLHHNMMVTDLRRAYLSVISGNTWDYAEVEYNDEYAAALLKVETEFWECVRLNLPPSDPPVVIEPPEATRVLDMEGNNEWGSLAGDWLLNEAAAKAFERAAKGLKALVPADARSCSGNGIRIDRDKRRALRISQVGPVK